mgnify:CR=1 FL=1
MDNSNFKEAVSILLKEQGVDEASKFLVARGLEPKQYLRDNFGIGDEITADESPGDEIVDSAAEFFSSKDSVEEAIEEVENRKSLFNRLFNR